MQICFSDSFYINNTHYQNNQKIKRVALGFIVLPKRVPLLNESQTLIGFQVQQSIELFPHYQRNHLKMIEKMRDYISQTYKGDND